jgi:hypothetical protein|nr:MAG TPA_asm: hypothetical protein [Caudoviricetes sp.]
MRDILLEPLPTEWEGRAIDPDFRHMVWLSNQYLRGRATADPQGMAQEAVRRFYRDPVPPLDVPAAFQAMLKFFASGTETASNGKGSGGTATVSFDYSFDADYIVAAFQQAYGIDLTTAQMHWWRFRALFRALPEDTLMAKIMSWRSMDTSDMDGKTRQRYEDLKEAFALPKELKGGKRIVSVADHNAAFYARFRHD